jgi:limonene-1,2-epoxide hydrolase
LPPEVTERLDLLFQFCSTRRGKGDNHQPRSLPTHLRGDRLTSDEKALEQPIHKNPKGGIMTQDEIAARNVFKVRLFIDAWEAIRGKANVRKMIASIFAPAKKVEFKLLNVFGHDNKVITERLDQWDWDGSGTWQLQLPVCGMFELTEDGKIYEWREYYDNEHWNKHGGPSLAL